MLEKFLTVPQEEFNRYLSSAPELTEEEVDPRREAYRYSKVTAQAFYCEIFADTHFSV